MKGNPFNPTKMLKHNITNLLNENWQNQPPITAEIDPSNLCNSNCVWCMFKNYRNQVPTSISKNAMTSIIKELGNFGVKAIVFTGGGEPLMNNEVFPEAFHIIKDFKMQCGLVTNGLCIRPYIDNIKETCTFVRFSLDAAKHETYSQLHGLSHFGSASWNALCNDIKECAEEPKLDVGLSFLIHPNNYREVINFYKLGKELNVDYIQIRPVYDPQNPLTPEIIFSVKKDLDLYFYDKPKAYLQMDRFQQFYSKKCHATPLVTVIGADQNVYLCCQTRGNPEYTLGNLKEQSFTQIWHGQKRRQIINKINTTKCPPCRHNKYNQLLNQLQDVDHENFL